MSRWALLIALVGCGPKIDPLLPMKAELGLARRTPAGDAPHARVAVSRAAVAEIVDRALATDEPIVVPVMIGTAATITPKLGEPAVEIGPSPACDCPRIALSLDGTIDVELGGLMGRAVIAEGLGVSAFAAGTPTLSLDRSPEGQVIQLVPEPLDPWSIRISLAEQSGLLNDKVIERQVVGPLLQQLARPLPLFVIPTDTPLRLGKIELVAGSDLAGSLWLVAGPVPAPAPLDVDADWAVGVTEAGLTAAARAVFAELPQTGRWRLEPTAVQMRDGRLGLDFRLHKVARRPKWRSYHVDAALEIGERVVLRPVAVDELETRGFGMSLIGPFVRGRVRKQVLAFELDQPASIERPLGRASVIWALDGVRGDGGEVTLYGSVR